MYHSLQSASGILCELQALKRQRREWQQERAFLVDRNLDLELRLAKLEKEKADRQARRAARKDKRPKTPKSARGKADDTERVLFSNF